MSKSKHTDGSKQAKCKQTNKNDLAHFAMVISRYRYDLLVREFY